LTIAKIAVYPGSFDPITIGHIDIIQRVSKIFDSVIVVVSDMGDKNYLFNSSERAIFIKKCFENQKNIQVDTHQGLTIDYM